MVQCPAAFSVWRFSLVAICFVVSLAAENVSMSALETGLTITSWGQRWAFAQYAPASKQPGDSGMNERLGCESTALAQIMYFHGLCPSGSVTYTAPGFSETGMNFSTEAEAYGLCEWDRFAAAPPNSTSAASTKAVARYIYAASLVLEKKWGTGSYMISHSKSARATEKHYGVRIKVVSIMRSATLNDIKEAIMADIDKNQPLKLHIASKAHSSGHESTKQYHHVVVDGYQHKMGRFWVHLNVGHSGYDNDWYDVEKPICLQHYPNGSKPVAGRCAHYYDDVLYKELWRIEPVTGAAAAQSAGIASPLPAANSSTIIV